MRRRRRSAGTGNSASARKYWVVSRSPFYSLVFTLPLFILYEVMILFLNQSSILALRNGADVLVRQTVAAFGVWGLYALSVGFLIAFVGVFLYQKKNWHGTGVRAEYLLKMLAEGLGWGLLLFAVLKVGDMYLMFPSGSLLAQQLSLAIGAGLYEEFVFRVLIIGVTSGVLRLVFQWPSIAGKLVGLVVSAILFSLFHFVGDFGDSFSQSAFLFRALAGLLLGGLYLGRGYGITVLAHTIYDFLVILEVTVFPAEWSFPNA